jgi:BirA family transcriptional regulator, biotin operon repressor / biotin---[acetyl-CoA-carboxylase] ligase
MNRLEPKILRYGSLASTNTEAARLASEGAAEGLTIVADEQTAGRGRLQRMWISPAGAGLYVSILLRPKIPINRWSLVTFAAALAVHDALFAACGVEADIKWPNDILAGERKICGILAEAIETNAGRAVVVGIGINLTREAFPKQLAEIATSVEESTGYRPNREILLSRLLESLSGWYELLEGTSGANTIRIAWISNSSYASGKRVRISNGDEVFEGVTRGLEVDGALRVETETEGIRIVRAGDIVSVRPCS